TLGLDLAIGSSGELRAAQTVQATENYDTFTAWCHHQQEISPEARHTVSTLLDQVGTTDCDQAQMMLSSMVFLALPGQQLQDLRPIASLTQLQMLLLLDNQIEDLSPLSSLTNLTSLDVAKNQIRDVQPLAPLTQLSMANLMDNPIDQKICPLPKARVCIFSDDQGDGYELAEAAYNQGNFAQALLGFEAALSSYTQANDRVRIARTKTRIADTQTNLGNYGQAIVNYQSSIKLRQGLGIRGA
ncbi:MAG: hypothetical protein HC796_01315, partial [Synechococcaceae cyanobacterium RL_1_2]|nr:hypothetical protein [Synechococcaceae cyanobacterium RL_1_2]